MALFTNAHSHLTVSTDFIVHFSHSSKSQDTDLGKLNTLNLLLSAGRKFFSNTDLPTWDLDNGVNIGMWQAIRKFKIL